MLRSFPIAVVLVLLVEGQERPTFRADVSQVHVDAEVLNKGGHIITGLTRSDFRLFDEGKEQSLVGFATEEQSLDIILLFDVSGSMRSKVEKVVGASHQAMRELRPGDRVAVMTFTTSTRLVGPFTDDQGAVEHYIEDVLGLRFGDGTYIHQPVD